MWATLTFLGTSAGVPTKTRNVSALALQPIQSKNWILFDCGEGTQYRLMQTALSLYHLDTIFITHLHGDHIYGLFGLLASRGMTRATTPLTIYAPKGLKEMVHCVMRASQLHLPFELKIHTLIPNRTIACQDMRIDPIPLSHSIPSYGFVVHMAPKPGHLNINKIRALGIPEGPLLARIQRGESIVLDDGRQFDARELVGPPRPGPVVAIGGDNDDPMRFAPFAPYDLMIHEATYTQYDFDRLPRKFKHTTAKQLGCAAQTMGVEHLILTHISPRYDTPERLNELLEEAKKCFDGRITIANDLLEIRI